MRYGRRIAVGFEAEDDRVTGTHRDVDINVIKADVR